MMIPTAINTISIAVMVLKGCASGLKVG
jgi:hypothetical protein